MGRAKPQRAAARPHRRGLRHPHDQRARPYSLPALCWLRRLEFYPPSQRSGDDPGRRQRRHYDLRRRQPGIAGIRRRRSDDRPRLLRTAVVRSPGYRMAESPAAGSGPAACGPARNRAWPLRGNASAFRDGSRLADLVAPHSPLLALVDSVWRIGNTISEYDILLEGPRFPGRLITIQGALTGEGADMLVLTLHERSMAEMMDRHLTHRNAARSITGMAAMLAHEVKNPLSGIRGAAQLLEQDADPAERELTQLICDETDRIVALVDRMEAFSDYRPTEREEGNIHEGLERVREAEPSGFDRHVRLVEEYDPSLPSVHGDRDQLVQVFLNLVKNAAEAVPHADGEIILSTAYRHGLRLTRPGGE